MFKKSEKGLRRVGVVAREWGNMAKHYTVHKAVVACVSGENVARIVARIGEDWRGLARIAKFGYTDFSSIKQRDAAEQKGDRMAKRKQSRAPEGADKGGQIGQGIARGSTKLVHDRLAAERHLLARRK